MFVLATVVLAAVITPAAEARRSAHGRQKAAILRASGFGPHTIPPCYDVYISTVNSSWATATYGGSTTEPCVRYGSNGVVILRFRRGRWHIVTEGSAFTCPIPGHIPARVQRDLKLACSTMAL